MEYKLIVHVSCVDPDMSSSYQKERYKITEISDDEAIAQARKTLQHLQGLSCNSMAALEADLYDHNGVHLIHLK